MESRTCPASPLPPSANRMMSSRRRERRSHDCALPTTLDPDSIGDWLRYWEWVWDWDWDLGMILRVKRAFLLNRGFWSVTQSHSRYISQSPIESGPCWIGAQDSKFALLVLMSYDVNDNGNLTMCFTALIGLQITERTFAEGVAQLCCTH